MGGPGESPSTELWVVQVKVHRLHHGLSMSESGSVSVFKRKLKSSF